MKCTILFLVAALGNGFAATMEWRVAQRKITGAGMEVKLVLEPIASEPKPGEFASAQRAPEKRRIEVTEENGKLTYAPVGSRSADKLLSLSTNDAAEIAALAKLTEEFAKAEIGGNDENRFRAAAKAYRGKLGPVWDCNMMVLESAIYFEKKEANGSRVSIQEPDGLRWLLTNLRVVSESRAELEREAAEALARAAKAREAEIEAAKRESEARIKAAEEKKRAEAEAKVQAGKLAEIQRAEKERLAEAEAKVREETRQKAVAFAESKQGAALIKKIKQAEAAAAAERGTKNQQIRARLKPLQEEEARIYQSLQRAGSSANVKMYNELLLANQDKQAAARRDAGDSGITSYDLEIDRLKQEFEAQSKVKYGAAVEFLK